MTENELTQEVKKAVELFGDKTYELADLESHILAIVRDAADHGQKHKEQLERVIYLFEELRKNQRLYFAGHKSKLGECKKQETELDNKIKYLITIGGYSIQRFQDRSVQEKLFK